MARRLGVGYEVHDVIGGGALGQVWQGTAVADGSPVAVKLLRPDLGTDDEVLAGFARERAALEGLDHPNVVRVRGLVGDGGELALVMDLVPGPDLRRVLANSPGGTLQPGLALDLAGQVLAGLGALHAAGVVHGDVKPSNVLVDRTGSGGPRAKVADFGVVGMVGGRALTRRTSLLGTPAYLAPEVIDGAPVGPPADVYAAGTLLYELLFGRTPFGGGSHLSVLRRHREDQPERPPGAPDELWAVLSQLLAKDPARRPAAGAASGAVMAVAPALAGRPPFSALGRGGDSDGTGLRRKPAGRPAAVGPEVDAPRPRPRQRLAVAALGLAFVVALVAAGLVLRPGSETAPPSPGGRYAFAPVRLDTGVVVARTWSLDDEGRFRGVVTVTNDGATPAPVELDEVLPASLADHVDRVFFAPPPDEVVDPSLAVRWRLGPLAPGQSAEVAYEVAVRPQRNGVERLRTWADQRDRLLVPGTGAALVELSIDPGRVQLATGQRFALSARGSMADATPAPPAVLAGLAWSSTDPGVATVEHGTLRALARGRTTVLAQAGPLVSRVEVVVADPPADVAAPPAAPEPAPAAPPPAASTAAARRAAPVPATVAAAPPSTRTQLPAALSPEQPPTVSTTIAPPGPSMTIVAPTTTTTRAAPATTRPPATTTTTAVPRSAPTRVYRLFHRDLVDHLYTVDPVERALAVDAGYTFEHVAFRAHPAAVEGSIPVFQLVHPAVVKHLYTANATERDVLMASGYRLERIAFHAFALAAPGTVPVFRLHSVGSGDHLYTISASERDRAVITADYRSEGVAFWAYPE